MFPSANFRPLSCLRTSEGPLIIVFMAVWGLLLQLSTRWRLWHLCGIPSLINAIPWDMSVGIWRVLWKFTSVTVLIPPGSSLAHSIRRTHRQSFQTMSAPSLQGIALLLKTNKQTKLTPTHSHIYLYIVGDVTLNLPRGCLNPWH